MDFGAAFTAAPLFPTLTLADRGDVRFGRFYVRVPFIKYLGDISICNNHKSQDKHEKVGYFLL